MSSKAVGIGSDCAAIRRFATGVAEMVVVVCPPQEEQFVSWQIRLSFAHACI